MSVYDSSIPESKEERQKLTLGLNKSVIERAKAAGINISAITEHLLRAITYDPNGNTKDDVIRAYEALFNAIRPLLIQYDTRIDVGKIRHYNDPECKEISYQDSILLEKVGLILYDEDRNSKKNTSKTKQDLLDHRIDRLQSSKSANP